MDLLHPALLPGWAAEIGFTLLVKGSLLLAAAWLLAGWARRGSAATRYALWMAGLVGLLLLPLLPVAIPGLNLAWIESPITAPTPVAVDLIERAQPAAFTPSWTSADGDRGGTWRFLSGLARPLTLLLAVWALGALLLFGRLVLDWVRIAAITARAARGGIHRRLTRRTVVLARRQGVQRRLRVVQSADMQIPVTWGLWRPVVILPADATEWDPGQLDAVLLHELAHVRRWDYLTHVLSEASRALYWPNPLVWLALRRARMERERACDDAVIRFGTVSADYARLLLDLARTLAGRRVERGAMAMARPSMLSTRITSVLDSASDRRPVARVRVVLAALLLIGVVAPLGTVRVWASPPRTESDWIAALDRADPEMRLTAVHVLEGIASSAAVHALSGVLADEAPAVRRTAVRALGRLADEGAVAALVGVVTGTHGDLHQKRMAAAALGDIDDRAAAEAWAAQLTGQGPGTRSMPGGLTVSSAPDRAVWEPLTRILLDDPDPQARSLAAVTLVEIGCEAAIPELIEATSDPSPVVRLAAVTALADFDTWPARRALATLADDPDPKVREAATGALECDTDGTH
jgi:beta-lactamase regulating signal transducer with metallopeptidase domain